MNTWYNETIRSAEVAIEQTFKIREVVQ